MSDSYIDATDESAVQLFSRNITGPVTMLNLLKFREVADYSAFPELAPRQPISGREAFQRYIDHTLPFLHDSGGEIEFLGEGGKYFVGPQDERWDLVMLIRQDSLNSFIAFATNESYIAGIGHRSASLEDSRLLPLEEYKDRNITSQGRVDGLPAAPA
ncbi:MAG: hypothetical protein NXH81_06590 [Halieaceae bacterium]|uniref:DUF1330 domain-containing protein n=1 Tax=Haliea alexandrii TaxID=2448162 RepID=UPI000F0B600F|nr:DUF1330 domain-containing protein [Haliea alexandrii]MCR9185044.1 hypothetical protein [Halieaceae bacterium]